MDKIDDLIKSKKGKYLIVNRRYFELIQDYIGKSKKIKDSFLIEVETYKGLIVAVTDKQNFTFDII